MWCYPYKVYAMKKISVYKSWMKRLRDYKIRLDLDLEELTKEERVAVSSKLGVVYELCGYLESVEDILNQNNGSF